MKWSLYLTKLSKTFCWFNKNIKQLIQEKNNTYKSYTLIDKNPQIFERVKILQNQLKCSIEGSKKKYYLQISKKLMDPATSAKTYWSMLKTLLSNKKIPCIPLLFHQSKSVTDFKKKAELFNSFFAKQCSMIQNSGKLPLTLNKKTENSISSITFDRNDIAIIIRSLDPNKAHGYDLISIPMLKICDKSICKPLELIFQSCIKHGKFPNEWKMANVVPVHKKSDEQILKNCRPVSLLPICGKRFERLIHNSLFEYFIQNDVLSPNQSGFKPGDSCTNQLISITHEIYQSFDDGFEVRGVFLDISKAFDKVWHNDLIYKLKQNGVASDLLDTLTNFLKERKQRVVLNGQYSTWTNVEVGAPQGLILGPLLFLIYINDLPENLVSNPKLFAGDTLVFSVIRNKHLSAQNLNKDLNKINHWAFQWKMSFNPDPSKQAQGVIFSRKLQKSVYAPLYFNNIAVTQSTTQKHLGMILDIKLDFQGHLENIYSKVDKIIGLLRKLNNTLLPRLPLLTIYKSFIRPHADYGDV